MAIKKKSQSSADHVDDPDEHDDDVPPVRYDISSYGADYPVDGLVKRLKREEIFVPEFQRDYVWNQAEASRFIESLLLGLPVPGVFLARESETNKLLIIDGQQRLKSLQFFYEGFFNPKEEQKTKRVFKLVKVQHRFEGLTYTKLSEVDRIKLDDSIIHATIIKQETPEEDNTSIYHVFERLNSGGKKLTPQEIRTAIYHGTLNDLIENLNENTDWRDQFGPINSRLKDRELILRFLAAFYYSAKYEKPMVEFLNKFNLVKRNPPEKFLEESAQLFIETIEFINLHLGKIAFRPERVINVAVFEAIMVGVAHLIKSNRRINIERFKRIHKALMDDDNFVKSTTSGTSDEKVFKERQRIVREYFSRL